MYDEAPQNVISLHEFQSIALDRLQMLRKIEFMHDSNEPELEIMQMTNKYAIKHGLAFEGRFEGKKGNDGSVYFKPCNF